MKLPEIEPGDGGEYHWRTNEVYDQGGLNVGDSHTDKHYGTA